MQGNAGPQEFKKSWEIYDKSTKKELDYRLIAYHKDKYISEFLRKGLAIDIWYAQNAEKRLTHIRLDAAVAKMLSLRNGA